MAATAKKIDLWQQSDAPLGPEETNLTDRKVEVPAPSVSRIPGEFKKAVLFADILAKNTYSPTEHLPSSPDYPLNPETQNITVSENIVEAFIPPRLLEVDKVWEIENLLKQYECYVESIEQESFWARAVDRDGVELDELVEFDVDEVAITDRPLIHEGAVFYWFIGRRDTPTGRKNESFLRFRRLPAFTKRDLTRAKHKANELYAFFAPSTAEKAD